MSLITVMDWINPSLFNLVIMSMRSPMVILGVPFVFQSLSPIYLIERLPITVELSLAALLVSILIGIPLGVISAVRHNSWIDVLTMLWANTGVSMPVFWLGLMLAYIFALALKDTPFQLPPSGRLSPGLITSTILRNLETYELTEGTATFTILNFISRMNIINGLLTSDFALGKGCTSSI